MSIFESVFYLLDLLVLLTPFVLMAVRSIKIGCLSMLLWLPVAGFHFVMSYVALGCGHGSGTGGVCDLVILIAYGPQICALVLFYLVFRKTADYALKGQ